MCFTEHINKQHIYLMYSFSLWDKKTALNRSAVFFVINTHLYNSKKNLCGIKKDNP